LESNRKARSFENENHCPYFSRESLGHFSRLKKKTPKIAHREGERRRLQRRGERKKNMFIDLNVRRLIASAASGNFLEIDGAMS
jgi:hypothetical protein